MTVKSKKETKRFSIPKWFKVALSIILLSAAIGYAVYSAIKNQQLNRLERQKVYDKAYDIKHNDIVSKKYALLCKDTILQIGSYEIIMIKKKFKIVDGKELSTIEKTFSEDDCSVIYIVEPSKGEQ